jgi:hypothetical protein
MCWNENDISLWKGFEGRHTYNKNQLDGRLIPIPFKLNALENNRCDLMCANGYWSNILSQYNPAEDTMMQRCTHDNCKRTSLGPIDIEPTTKFATEKTEAEIFVFGDNKGLTMEMEEYTDFDKSFSPNRGGTSQMLITGLTIDYRTKKAI